MGSVTFAAITQSAGGPLGSIVGAIAGASIDRALARNGRTQAGGALALRSAYGEPLPRLYGRCRTGGVLIWATPLARGGGGKGGGRRAYVASFAIALSARPIRAIRAIWADGRQVLDESGRMDPPFVMRVHRGDGRGEADPLLMAHEGVDRAPGYRHLAWVIFDQFPLGPFGNRIPAMSFEVEADAEEADPADWLVDLAGEAGVAADSGTARFRATGFAARGERLREDLETLSLLAGREPAEGAGRQRLRDGGQPIRIPAADLVVDDGTGFDPLSCIRGRDGAPRRLLLSYLDPARDYQVSEQRAGGMDAGPALVIATEVAMPAQVARATTDAILRERIAESDELQLRLPWRWLHLGCGDLIRIGDAAECWRIHRRRVEGLVVSLSCARVPVSREVSSVPADPGRFLPAPPTPPGPTLVGLFDPPAGLPGTGGPGIMVLVSGGPDWRGATLAVRVGSGAPVEFADPARCVTGQLETPLPFGSSLLWDERSRPVILLDWEDQWLESHSARSVLSGAGRLIIGEEIVHYRIAEALGTRRYRLHGLLRGVDGSRPRVPGHLPGTRFWLTAATECVVPLTIVQLGERVECVAAGAGDPTDGSQVGMPWVGNSASVWAPCHVRASRTEHGDIVCSWIPRSREDLPWRAQSETAERWHGLEIRAEGATPIALRVRGNVYVWTLAAQLAQLGSPVAAFSLGVTAEGDGPIELRRSASVSIRF